MNKYEFIPLVLMKSGKAGVLEYLQLSYRQGPAGTNRPYWPCLASPGASSSPAQDPNPAPGAVSPCPGDAAAVLVPSCPQPCLAVLGQCLTLGTHSEPDPDLQVDLPAWPWTCPITTNLPDDLGAELTPAAIPGSALLASVSKCPNGLFPPALNQMIKRKNDPSDFICSVLCYLSNRSISRDLLPGLLWKEVCVRQNLATTVSWGRQVASERASPHLRPESVFAHLFPSPGSGGSQSPPWSADSQIWWIQLQYQFPGSSSSSFHALICCN